MGLEMGDFRGSTAQGNEAPSSTPTNGRKVSVLVIQILTAFTIIFLAGSAILAIGTRRNRDISSSGI